MELLRTAIASLVFAFGSLCATAAIAAHGGRWNPRLDVLTHFAPIWLLGGLVVLASIPISPPGHNRTLNLLAGGVAVLAALGLVVPEYLRPMSARAPADAPRQLKLIQFNTKGDLTATKDAADWILAEKADVVVLEEASQPLVQALRRRGFHAACGGCSVVVLSRARPIASDVPQVDFRTGARAPTARASFAAADGGYSVVGVHYVWPTYGDMQQRQGKRLARVLAELPQDRLILAGDFNSTPWSYARRAEDRMFGLERRTKAVFSWPTGQDAPAWRRSPIPILPIDHVYAGRDWKTVSVTRGPRLGSDHFPVVVVLALDPQD
jgi:endonuclease/exonuclease/phosphatase (EEP) superfamily protein YafD